MAFSGFSGFAQGSTSDALRIARRCRVDAAFAEDLAVRCHAVLATCTPHSVIASVTAARMHAAWLPELPNAIHIATASPGRQARQMTRTRRPEFIVHRFQLRPEDIVVMDGVALTSPARTWRDLARVLSLADLVAAGDSLLRAGTSRAELEDIVASVAPRLRTSRLTRALSLLDERSRSRPESHVRVAISTPDLPRFDVNMAVHRDEGGWLAEPDLSLPDAKLATEYQGADHAEVIRMRKDMTRFADLRRESWLVLPYGPAETFQAPLGNLGRGPQGGSRPRAASAAQSANRWSVNESGGQPTRGHQNTQVTTGSWSAGEGGSDA